MESKQTKDVTVKIGVDATELDATIEKANQLKALLAEVKELTDSLDLKITCKTI